MVNTLAGTYLSSAMVVMRNLRLPEFDKNRNVEQQNALIFESETCKYDVILGAAFLTKTEIDVRYSTGTMQWFEKMNYHSVIHTLLKIKIMWPWQKLLKFSKK